MTDFIGELVVKPYLKFLAVKHLVLNFLQTSVTNCHSGYGSPSVLGPITERLNFLKLKLVVSINCIKTKIRTLNMPISVTIWYLLKNIILCGKAGLQMILDRIHQHVLLHIDER